MQFSQAAASAIGFLQGIGTTELLLIFLVVLLLFGAKKLPELARGMGKSIKEFKKATNEIEDDIRTAIDSPETPAKPQAQVEIPNKVSPAPAPPTAPAPDPADPASPAAESTEAEQTTPTPAEGNKS